MKSDELALVAALIRDARVAALATLRDGAPFVSMVAAVAEPGFDGFLLHLSRLAAHTGQLIADQRASLLFAERDDGRDDPQTLARLTLLGSATVLHKDALDYPAARQRYLAHLPAAAMLFDFPDFMLFRFVPTEARYIGGFARAYTLTPELLSKAALVKG